MGKLRLVAMAFAVMLVLGGASTALADHAEELHQDGAPDNRPCAVEHPTENTDNPVVDENMGDCGEHGGEPPKIVLPELPKIVTPELSKKDLDTNQ